MSRSSEQSSRTSEQSSTTPAESGRGRFIAFEGGDGSGKSTQAGLLAERLGAELTREPGGTSISDKIRQVVLDPAHGELTDRTEALLMAAARAQHVEERIVPALSAGRHVVSDRFVASSLAYQGVGRDLGVDVVAELNEFATNGLEPDLTVFLDTDPSAARGRLGDDLDRIEEAGEDLGRTVVETYRRFAAESPDCWVLVDANGSIDEVSARVAEAVHDRLGL